MPQGETMDARVKEIEARLKEAVDPEYSGRESIALRASVADIPYLLTALRESEEREKKLVEAAEQLADAMDTCHICKGKLVLEEYPSYCEGCSPCCDEHDDPECPTINTLHRKLRTAIAAVKEKANGR